MDNKNQTDDLLDFENVEIQPLSEQDLESVSGGDDVSASLCSGWCCSNG